MEYGKLGNTDIEVSKLCVGCMSFGKAGTMHDWTLDEAESEALHDLVKAGKVRALGASAMYGYQFYNMQLAARDNGWTPFSAMENHYNLLYREDERELLPICKQMKFSLQNVPDSHCMAVGKGNSIAYYWGNQNAVSG